MMYLPVGLTDCVLIAALVWAVITDLRSRRIRNRLTYPAMAIGLAANAATGGWSGLSTSALGWLVALGLMLLPFAMGAMGAGDVKLLLAIGALKGPHFVLLVAVYGGLAGGLLALYYLAKERRVASTLRYILYGWLWALRGSGPKAGAIPYAPAIAAGAIIALLPFSPITL
jgi:prepilin peptidase CpaA